MTDTPSPSRCSGEPVIDGGLPADGPIYPGDPAHCEACRKASPSRAGERLHEELESTARVLRRAYGPTNKTIEQTAQLLEGAAVALEAAAAAIRTAKQERDELEARIVSVEEQARELEGLRVIAESQLTARDQTIAQLRELLNARRDDNTKQACDECEHCSRILMCNYHSLLSDLAALTPPR